MGRLKGRDNGKGKSRGEGKAMMRRERVGARGKFWSKG